MTGPGPYSLATYCYFIGRITSCINGRNDLPEMLPFKETHKDSGVEVVQWLAQPRYVEFLTCYLTGNDEKIQ